MVIILVKHTEDAIESSNVVRLQSLFMFRAKGGERERRGQRVVEAFRTTRQNINNTLVEASYIGRTGNTETLCAAVKTWEICALYFAEHSKYASALIRLLSRFNQK